MKLIMVAALFVVAYFLRGIGGGDSPLADLNGPMYLWLSVSLLAISQMGSGDTAVDAKNVAQPYPNPLTESSFAGSSFLSPNQSLQ